MLSVVLSVIVLVLFVFFYQKIFAITFDETFAQATGVKAGLYNTLIAVLTAVTIVLGMRMMGALLISSLIIFPGAHIHAGVQDVPRSGDQCSGSLGCVLCGRYHGVLSVCDSCGASVVMANIAALVIYAVIGAVRNLGSGSRRK